MDCSEYQKLMSMLIDGELGERSSEGLKRHLDACLGCRKAYECMAALNETLNAAGLYRPPSMLATRVKARLAEKNQLPKEWHFPRAWRQAPLLAMIVLLAIGLGNLAGRSMTQIFIGEQPESGLEYLLTDAGQSLSDIFLDIAVEENSQ